MKKKKNILVIGAFGGAKSKMEGQSVKTHNVYNMLIRRFDGNVSIFDTLSVKKNPLLLFKLFAQILKCDISIIIPASGSFEKFFPFLYLMSKIFRFEIILICVGGWQVEFFLGKDIYKPHPLHLKLSKKIKAFLPQVKLVTKQLTENFGFNNCETLNNFRIVEEKNVDIKINTSTLRLVYMARIHKNKGYNIIFNFVEHIKDMNLDIKIDFYGNINKSNKDEFLHLVDKYQNIVTYKDVLPPDKVNSCLSTYDILLFPTRYFTEGIAGSVLDAYLAKIPVIATNWKFAPEIIEDGVNGIIIPFDDCQEAFNSSLLHLYYDRNYLMQLKLGASKTAKHFSEQAAWDVISKYL